MVGDWPRGPQPKRVRQLLALTRSDSRQLPFPLLEVDRRFCGEGRFYWVCAKAEGGPTPLDLINGRT